MAKIMVAMSGGVDSSLAAALLHEAGHDVTGVTMDLWGGDDERLMESLCCSQEMTERARRVWAQLGIPYYVFNYRWEFRRFGIEYFLREYTGGYTPNHGLQCNAGVEFLVQMAPAQWLGFDYVATRHDARIRASPLSVVSDQGATQRDNVWQQTDYGPRTKDDGQYELLRATDMDKDQ